MLEKIKEEAIAKNPIIAQQLKIGICEGKPKDGFVITFKGKCASANDDKDVSIIIPVDGISEIIQGLFAVGVNYQQSTGIDIGFADVIKEKNRE